MKVLNYFSALSIPTIIVYTIIVGLRENKNVYILFIEGVTEGLKTILKLFPILLAIFLSINMLKTSGLLNFVIKILSKIFYFKGFPTEVLPLAILKPISGSASIAMGTDLMKTYGVDSKIGKITATIMGSTETTFYVIATYTNNLKIRDMRHIVLIAVLTDIVGIFVAIMIYSLIF